MKAGGSSLADVTSPAFSSVDHATPAMCAAGTVFAVDLEANLREVSSLTITEKAFTYFKAPASAFTFKKSLLREATYVHTSRRPIFSSDLQTAL